MKQPLTVGSLFSGIGGLDLGFVRAGFEIRWMCEIDPFCRKVLAKHWPEVPIYEDIRTLSRDEVESVDVIIGGFPCQDISTAGKRVGINGARSGLWWEMFRLICELRPRYVAIENVSILYRRGLGVVLGCLAEIGYDAEWDTLSACMFGAPHMRRRMFIVAYPYHEGREQFCKERARSNGEDENRQVAPSCEIRQGLRSQTVNAFSDLFGQSRWEPKPGICRVYDGPAIGVDRKRLEATGNAVVPQVAQYVARCIAAHAEANP